MQRFKIIGPDAMKDAGGPWVSHREANAAVIAANQRATEAERRLALAVAEVKAWRTFANAAEDSSWNEAWKDHGDACANAEYATHQDPVLAKMIGGG